jgi:hypothetical protein
VERLPFRVPSPLGRKTHQRASHWLGLRLPRSRRDEAARACTHKHGPLDKCSLLGRTGNAGLVGMTRMTRSRLA